MWILGNGDTLSNSSKIWKRLVANAKIRNCFHVGNKDKSLAQVITNTLVELGQFDGLLDNNSLLFKEAKWKARQKTQSFFYLVMLLNTCCQIHQLHVSFII